MAIVNHDCGGDESASDFCVGFVERRHGPSTGFAASITLSASSDCTTNLPCFETSVLVR